MANHQLFHIIWTVFNAYPVWDKRGNWQKLSATYAELEKHHISYHPYKTLHPEYTNRHSQQEPTLLSEKAIAQLKSDIENLCQDNKDRIIDGLKIKMLRIDPSKVEMLVLSDAAVLAQKIGRLKSRTATLLSFEYPETYVGKGTWGKGFWYSNILNKEDLAIAIIKDYRLK
ncbi:hypothetical protein E6C50_08605 [Flavobacterium supellecticarium]|uniref:Uncharacterized protein n=1 Tax=Flavobacterium supellecticarium TaxID=2565924 RepID=A0A4S4A0H2_9FLAO|nr:hypothetical protein [Flavobacterium supellecticarium]THF51806.1 hypothetical protein E6C50_08605 [Flavobacterium supellecticarium]